MTYYIYFFIVCFLVLSNPMCYGLVTDEEEQQINILNSKALKYEEQENYEAAIECFKKTIQIDPKNLHALGELCFCYGSIGKNADLFNTAKKGLLVSQKQANNDYIGRFYAYMAGALKVTNRFEKATKLYSLAIVNKPHYMPNYLSLAYCYYKLDKFDKANEYYKLIQEKDPDYAKENGIEEAILELRSIEEKKFPDKKFATLGFINLQKNQKEEAIHNFEKSLENNPNNIISLHFLADYAFKEENWQKAIKYGKKAYNLVIKKENSSYKFLYSPICLCLSISYQNLNDFDNSSHYARLFSQSEALKKAKELLNQFKLEEALKTYNEGIMKDEDNFKVYSGIIQMLYLINKSEEAFKYANLAIKECKENDENDSLAYYNWYIAKYYGEKNEPDKALSYCKKAIEIANDYSNKYKFEYNLAAIYQNKNELNKTLECYKTCLDYVKKGAEDIYDIKSIIIRMEEALNENSDLSQSEKHFNQAIQHFFYDKNPEAAIKELKLALKHISQDIESLDLLARCYYALKDYDNTYKCAHEGYVLSLRDRNFKCMEMLCYNIANCYYNNGDYKNAVVYYQQAHEQNGKDVDNLYFIGACYRNMQQYDKALKAFEEAQKLAPNDKDIAKQILLCKSHLK